MTFRALATALAACSVLSLPTWAQSPPAPAGSEFLVNVYTTGTQKVPAVVKDGNGNFVVVWHSGGKDGSGDAIIGRLFDTNGAPLTGDFQVNTYTTGDQRNAAVAVDGFGNFVVAWDSFGQDGSGNALLARRFDSAGSPLGGEFQVNTYTSLGQQSASISADLIGNFTVAWESFGQDGEAFGTFARRFDSSGAPLTGELQVNTYTTSSQGGPAVAQDLAGTFTVIWNGDLKDGSSLGVFGRRFDSAGSPLTAEFQVNTYTTGQQREPAVAGDLFGNFMVVWSSYLQDGSYFGVFGRRFDINGSPLDIAEFPVSTYTSHNQRRAAITTAAGDSFVVAWESYGQDGSYLGVFARPYDSTGQPGSGEFQVNTFTTGQQAYATVGADDQGRFVIAWGGYDQEGSGSGIFAQRFGGSASSCTPGDADADGSCDDVDNCLGVYNPGQENGDGDGRGDDCDIIMTNPLDGATIDCTDPRTIKPTITWEPGVYDRFRVDVAWDPSFAKGFVVNSGGTLLKTPAWTPATKKMKKLCTNALAADPINPTVYIHVFGKDVSAASSDPDKTTLSDEVAAGVID